MSVPSGTENYSTLEVATDADVLRQGKYPEVVPPSIPEAYGYYEPPKPGQAAQQPEQAKLLYSGAQGALPPTAQSYSTYPEVVDEGTNGAGGGGEKVSKICGLPRKYFWLALGAAIILAIVAIVVGAVVGTMKNHAAVSSPAGDGQENTGNSTGSTKTELFEDTRLASANFTDAYGNDNFLLVYQLSDASIRLSAFNSSSNAWVASTVINGTNGVKLGTSLAIDTFWEGSASPDVNLYYQSDGSATTIMSLSYNSNQNLSTTSKTPAKNWKPVSTVSGFNSIPGSALAAYGKQCNYCNQYAYFFWQGEQGLYMAENSGDGIKDADLIDVDETPSANTSMALTYSGTLQGDGNAIARRSINIFYRSKTSGLTQLRIGNGMNIPQYVGRDIGPLTNLATFSTGFNESDSDNPNPLGFQVLSIDPDANDGVQLTYLKDSEWATTTDSVDDLADCQAKATMTAHTGRRLYCLVDSGGDTGLEIIEWAWQGDPNDENTYLNWKKIGPVKYTL
ncbi:hypothetical protein F5Y12DRAFT_759853, partial [Xylaria sp. FL1777]